jgi:RNase P subunit RPR2
MQMFEQLKSLLEVAEADYEKFHNGNKTAGTRVRKYMQEIKKIAQEIRVKVQETKNASKEK